MIDVLKLMHKSNYLTILCDIIKAFIRYQTSPHSKMKNPASSKVRVILEVKIHFPYRYINHFNVC